MKYNYAIPLFAIALMVMTLLWHFRHKLGYVNHPGPPKQILVSNQLQYFESIIDSYIYSSLDEDPPNNFLEWLHSSDSSFDELVKKMKCNPKHLWGVSGSILEGKDLWGNQLVYQFVPHDHIRLYSIGKNGQDEKGQGDDIVIEVDFSWYDK